MLNLRMTKGRKAFAAAFILLVALSTLFASLAFFTDRANKTTTIKVSTFNDDGYSIEQQAPAGWFVAGETLEVQIEESNEKEEPITSQITMRVVWDSPVDGVYPWGNDDSAENAVITVDGEPISYSSDGDAITFTLPKTTLNANTSVETPLKFQIPSDLTSTGRLYFTYEEIKLSQYPSGWTASYDGIDLSELSFDVGVVWNISDNQSTKDVVAYLTDGVTANDANYGLCIVRAGTDANTNKGLMMDWAAAGETPWADYSITELSIGEKVTTIGDFAFAGELGITSVTFPSTVTDIGVSAFDGAGLTGTLTIPATVQSIDSLAFGNLQAVTVISFGHSNTESLAMADPGKSSSGAFYAGYPYTPTSPLGTTILSDNDDILDYAWNMDARGYTVTVQNVTGATVVATPTTAIPGKSIALTAAADAGYEYIGCVVSWSSGNTTLAADELSFTMPAANVTVSPTVSLITYTIHYETNGGTLGNDAPTSYNVTTDTFALPEPTRAGYTFDGWYETSNFSGSEVTQIVKGTTGDQTFYAKWTANTDTPYTVYHWKQNLNGGDAQNDTNYTLADTDHLTGTTDTKVTPDRKIYIGFISPSGTEITIGGDGTTELHYYYIRNSYTFTLGSCNGVSTSGSSPTGSYKYGATITLRSTTSVGYTWSQWISGNTGLVSNKTTANTTFTMPAGNISMTPSASLDSYSITYFPNGGTLPSDAVASYTVESSTITLPTPTRTGYTFVGWYTSSDLSGTSVTQIVKGSTGDKIFYAKWTPKTDTGYTVHHWKQNLDGDSEQNSTNYTLANTESLTGTTNTTVTPAVMDYTGFTAPTPQAVTIAADGSTVVNYYYTRNSYTFTLGNCSGVSTSGSTVSGSYRYESPITLESATQAGYTWVQWLSSDTSLINNLGMTSTEFNMPAGNITMTPSATLDSYTIDYELNGGTQGSGAVTSYTVESTVTLPTPTKTGYTFAGWYEDSNFSGSKVTQIAKGTTGNKMFYAKWTPNSDTAYTVNHYLQNLADDGYTLKETENKNGITGDSVTPATKTYEGFTSPSTQTVTIAADGSTVVNYHYTRNSYTFTLGSGTGVSTSGSTATGSYKYGATITLKATANTGYTWAKWTSDTTLVSGSTTANTTFKMPAGSVTMTPSATLNTYTIEYELNGGTQGSGAVTSYNVTTATFSLPKPTKTGYTFAGWYENSGLTGTAVTQIAQGSTGNKTFYAKWTANTNTAYTVKHYQQNITDDGYTLKEIENKSGITGQSVTPAVKTYTGFTSPSTQTVTIAADGSTVVNYYYTRNSYTFTLGSGTGVSTTGSSSTGSYKYGATITLKATASTGYTWNTWTSGNTSLVASTSTANTTFTMPAGNITMTPSATLNTYTISYVLNGGTQGSGAVTSYNITTATFSLPTPTKTGYTFAGWYENSDFSGTAATQIAKGSTGNKTLYANWTANTNTAYTVKHYQQNITDDGYTLKETENKTGTTGVSITPAVKTYTGFTSPSAQTVTIAADGSTTVNYYYTRNSYTFTLGTGTGVTTTGSTASGTYKYGATITLAASANTGYTWSTWTSSNTGLVTSTSTANTTFTMPAGSITMTPSATLNTYTISYVLNGGTQGSGAVTSYNVTTATFNLPTPTRTGYTFSGWYTSSSFSGSAVTQVAKGSTGNKTYYAKWTANTNTAYTVKHWQQTLTGGSTQNSTNFTLVATENVTGTTAASVTPAVKTYTGFTSPSTQTVTIAADGSTVVNYYYTRNSYTFTLGSGTGVSTSGSTSSGSYKYGATITLKATTSTGYTWSKWTSSNTGLVGNKTSASTTFTMPAGNITMTPSATLNTYTITYNLNGGTQGSGAVTSYNVTTATFSLPTPTKTGYVFAGWYTSSTFSGSAVTQIAKGTTGNKTYYAKWELDTKAFAVYCETDCSLTFYYGVVPAVGDTYSGKTVTAVYTGVDTDTYASSAYLPWRDYSESILSASFDTSFASVQPVSTAYWFHNAYLLDSFDQTNLDTSRTTNMRFMFYKCYALTDLDLSTFDTGSATNLSYMFSCCEALTNVTFGSKFTVSAAQTLNSMFDGCNVIETLDLSNFNTANVTSMRHMFSDCNYLTSLTLGTNFTTANVEDLSFMFAFCESMTSFDLSNFNTGKVTDMGSMFRGCESLTSVNVSSFNTANVTAMEYMFRGCKKLPALNLSTFDTSSVEDMTNMFDYMPQLREITLGSKFSFTGNGTTSCVLPTPDTIILSGADGKWYNTTTYVGYTPEELAEAHGGAIVKYTAIVPTGAASTSVASDIVTASFEGDLALAQAVSVGSTVEDKMQSNTGDVEFISLNLDLVEVSPPVIEVPSTPIDSAIFVTLPTPAPTGSQLTS